MPTSSTTRSTRTNSTTTTSLGYCQVEWVDDDLLIGLYVFGDGADPIDTDDLEVAFDPQLDQIAV